MISHLPIPVAGTRAPLQVPRKVAALVVLTAFLIGLGLLPAVLVLLNHFAR